MFRSVELLSNNGFKLYGTIGTAKYYRFEYKCRRNRKM